MAAITLDHGFRGARLDIKRFEVAADAELPQGRKGPGAGLCRVEAPGHPAFLGACCQASLRIAYLHSASVLTTVGGPVAGMRTVMRWW